MTPRIRRRAGRRAGFVLIEALATLAIGAFIIAALGSLIAFTLHFADGTAADLQRGETLGRVVALMEREIRGMARARYAGDQKTAFLFAGDVDRILFTTDRVDRSGLSATVAVAYQVAPDAGGVRLLRAEATVLPGLTDLKSLAFSKPRTLYTGTTGIRFSYFLPQPDGSGEVLVDTWKDRGKLPTAVRIATTGGDGSILDSLRVPVMTDAEPACAVPGKGFCSLDGAVQAGSGGGDGGDEGPAGHPPGGRNRPGFLR